MLLRDRIIRTIREKGQPMVEHFCHHAPCLLVQESKHFQYSQGSPSQLNCNNPGKSFCIPSSPQHVIQSATHSAHWSQQAGPTAAFCQACHSFRLFQCTSLTITTKFIILPSIQSIHSEFDPKLTATHTSGMTALTHGNNKAYHNDDPGPNQGLSLLRKFSKR